MNRAFDWSVQVWNIGRDTQANIYIYICVYVCVYVWHV